jgi:hypothetical protein
MSGGLHCGWRTPQIPLEGVKKGKLPTLVEILRTAGVVGKSVGYLEPCGSDEAAGDIPCNEPGITPASTVLNSTGHWDAHAVAKNGI